MSLCSAFKRAWGSLGGMECGQYMCKVSKLMLRFCSYLYALPQRINLKEGQCTILVSPLPRKLASLVSKLLQKAGGCCPLLVLFTTFSWVLQFSSLQRYFPWFPSCCAKKFTGSELTSNIALSFLLNSLLNWLLNLPKNTRKLFVHSQCEQRFLSVPFGSCPQQLLRGHLPTTRRSRLLHRKGSAARALEDEGCFKMVWG